MPKGRSSPEYAKALIFRICELNRGKEDKVLFCASDVGAGNQFSGPTQKSGILGVLVVLGYIQEAGRGRKNTLCYSATRESLQRLSGEVAKWQEKYATKK